MTLEQAILWCVYVGALEAKKQRRFEHITRTAHWTKLLTSMRSKLADMGLVL